MKISAPELLKLLGVPRWKPTFTYLSINRGGGPGGRTPHKIREIRVTTSKIDPEDFSLGKNGSSTPVHK